LRVVARRGLRQQGALEGLEELGVDHVLLRAFNFVRFLLQRLCQRAGCAASC
jgi:hypothetical protein